MFLVAQRRLPQERWKVVLRVIPPAKRRRGGLLLRGVASLQTARGLPKAPANQKAGVRVLSEPTSRRHSSSRAQMVTNSVSRADTATICASPLHIVRTWKPWLTATQMPPMLQRHGGADPSAR